MFLTTLGCRLNEAELESWSRQFHAAGHRVVATPHQAQVVVVNTCAVTGEAARKSRKFVGGLHRQNPSATLVITGCYAALEPEKAARLAGVDLVIGNADKDRLVSIVEAQIDPCAMPELAQEPEGSHVYEHKGRTRAFIKVQDGCRNRCTFCIVTVARGSERSRAIREIVAEINELTAAGFQEAVLTGVHLGGYGNDLDTDLITLVREILAQTRVPRLRLSSLEPWDLPDDFFTLWRNPRLMPHLHLPLQSGSDSVLKRMARRCSTSNYARLVDSARAAIPDVTVTTDLIVGFPGETDADWKTTTAFIQQVGFGHIHIFTYSPREGTAAARMPSQLRGDVKRHRSRQAHEIAARMKRERLVDAIGETRPVLWEGAAVPAPDGSLTWAGYTDNYLRVNTRVEPGVDLENVIAPAHLVRVCDGANHLIAG